ncbi:glycosyltransferase [Empedobacter falsenii]|uniref:glycosyltransferase n=1 Tax=Empedobacter falsenii TaxID=343874 RepID=UPI001C599839|nr:glycosyltransferase [Empedobacter falsenii]MBW1619341.1 hypothetical protein [Empedobacter falsenii]
MLSIIVSSYQEEYFTQFSENIKETIGDDFQYEIIQQWNPGLMGICEAYNKGAEKAKYDNLLFVHEDVLFETENWGHILINYLTNKENGCIGIAGSTYTPNVPFAWWDLHNSSFRHIQQYNKSTFIRSYILKEDKKCQSLDGVFLACRKDVYNQYKFNNRIKEFHCYDIDFSNRVANDFQNIITSSILLKHFSEGSINNEWFQSLIKNKKYFKKPKNQLIDKKREVYFFDCFIQYLNQFNFSKLAKIKLILQYANPKFIGYKRILKLLK